MERWWDGSAWTEYTRTAQGPAAAPQYPAYPGHPAQPAYLAHPGFPAPPGYAPGGGKRRTSTVVIAVLAALVLVGGVVAGVVALAKGGGGSDGGDDAKGSPSPKAGAPRHPRTPGGPGTPAIPAPPGPGIPGGGRGVVDLYDGISLPLLSGWQGRPASGGMGAGLVTQRYACPGDAAQTCVRGGVFSKPAAALKITATTPAAAARQDIAPNAADSYSPDVYGSTTGHREVLHAPVTVAGQPGYVIRWRISTASGTSGYVQSLAFRSPTVPGRLVVVRFGFDIGGQAPGPEVMDRITRGIAPARGGATGPGV